MFKAFRGFADHPFWTLVGLRLLFLLGTAGTLLWTPLHAGRMARDHAYGGLSDLIFGTFDQLDSELFIKIAKHGYDNAWHGGPAFFPVYPLFLRGSHYVFGSYLVGGVVISLVAAGLGAWALAEIARPILGDRGARDSVLYLALFPTACVFTAVYSDGVCFAFSAAAFLAAMRRRPWLAAIACGMAVGTRTLALALLPALIYLLWPRERRWRGLWGPLLPLATTGAAIGGYMVFLHYHRHDAFACAHAQADWNRHVPTLGPLGGLKEAIDEGVRSADLVIRHLPSASNAPAGFDLNYQFAFLNAAHLVFFAIAVWLTVVAWRKLGPAFGLYSAATLTLILSDPPKGFPLQAMPRYLLADFPLVLALAALTARRPGARTGTIATLAVLTTLGAIAFSRDTWLM
jgi:hypothetical protein